MNKNKKFSGIILIVDKNVENLESMGYYLSQLDFEVLTATDAQMALNQAKIGSPDIIILDMMVENNEEFKICELLKNDYLTKNIPIIFISQFTEVVDKVKAFKIGAVDYITTPFQPEELLARINTHLNISKLHKKLQYKNERLQLETLKKQKIEAALRNQIARERILGSMREKIRQSLNLQEILITTVEEVRRFLQTDRVVIYQFQNNWSGIIVVESVSQKQFSILNKQITDPCFGENYIKPYRQGKIHSTKDIYKSNLQPCYIEFLEQFQVRSNLVVPILQTDSLWGLLIAHHCTEPRTWQNLDIDLLKQFSSQIAIAIQQAQLYEQLKIANQELYRLASLDGLTLLANRRKFDQFLTQEWRRMARDNQPLSLILCDVDCFKLYNDTYGHQAGDDCLRQVARAMNTTISRPGDLVARYGGEEFAIILPNTDQTTALSIAENLRLTIKNQAIPHSKSPIAKIVSLSLGVSTLIPRLETPPETLIATADKALYQAKQQGRDRVVAGILEKVTTPD